MRCNPTLQRHSSLWVEKQAIVKLYCDFWNVLKREKGPHKAHRCSSRTCKPLITEQNKKVSLEFFEKHQDGPRPLRAKFYGLIKWFGEREELLTIPNIPISTVTDSGGNAMHWASRERGYGN